MIRDFMPQFMAFYDGKFVGVGTLPVVTKALRKAREETALREAATLARKDSTHDR